MIRPSNFGFNIKTKYTNPLQYNIKEDHEFIKVKAIEEFDEMVNTLRSENIKVVVYEEFEGGKPDTVFISNWLSILEDKRMVIYPVLSKEEDETWHNDIINKLRDNAGIKTIFDLTFFEKENRFLEGGGSVVFDHLNKTAYASLSKRTNESVFNYLCNIISYKGFVFSAFDYKGKSIFHTNMILSITSSFIIVCLSSIDDILERTIIRTNLEQTGREVIDITMDQVFSFSGNCEEVYSKDGKSKLIMSRTAYHALKSKQIKVIEKYSEIVQVNVSIIERVGGSSVNCMALNHHEKG